MCECKQTCGCRPLDLKRPVQTRDGRKVRILCTDRKPIVGSLACSLNTVVGLVDMGDSGEQPHSWSPDGQFQSGRCRELDLVQAPDSVTATFRLLRSPAGDCSLVRTDLDDRLYLLLRKGWVCIGEKTITVTEGDK